MVEDEVVEPEVQQADEIEQAEPATESGVAEPAISETETLEETPVVMSGSDDSSDQVTESVDAVEESEDVAEAVPADHDRPGPASEKIYFKAFHVDRAPPVSYTHLTLPTNREV